jgi:hypothetical protein
MDYATDYFVHGHTCCPATYIIKILKSKRIRTDRKSKVGQEVKSHALPCLIIEEIMIGWHRSLKNLVA